MAESQYPYEYQPDVRDRLTEALTEVRLGKYLSGAGFRFDFAMDMYLWNARIAKSLQFPLHVMEVTLRNAICQHFNLCGAPENWAFDPQFVDSLSRRDAEIGSALNKSKWRLLKDRMREADFDRQVRDAGLAFLPSFGLIRTNDVVANLSLDFWVASMGGAFENDWHPTLRRVFPRIPGNIFRKDVLRSLVEVKTLRNRIAHHEPIFHLPRLVDTYRNAVDIVDFRCRSTSDWVRHHSTFLSVWHSRPQPSRHAGLPILKFAHEPNVVTNTNMTIADLISAMRGAKRDFVAVQSEGNISLIIGDDMARWLGKAVDVGLADLSETVSTFLNDNSLVSRVAILDASATVGQARALFSSRGVQANEKPTATIITTNGTATGVPKGVVFKPDL